MKLYKYFIFLLLSCSICLATVTYARESSGDQPIEIFPLDSIQDGMTGTGKTVFKGTAIEEFNVEILSVLRRYYPRKSVILAKLSGGPLEQTGVIAGMSGSPVYLDGKFAGAVAYAWWFAKEAIAGITPAEEMMELLDKDFTVPATLDLLGPAGTGGTLAPSSGNTTHQLFDLPESGAGYDGSMAGVTWQNMRSLRLPMVISGSRCGHLQSLWQEAVNPFGFVVVQGNSSGTISQPPPPLEPGSVLGVKLVGGDLDISAIGTLTYRSGEKILAFGHPMFLGGHVDLPMTGGYINAVMPTQYNSFKMGTTTDVTGSIRQDRSPGVAGIIGPTPFMIPFRLNLYDEHSQKPDIFNFTLARVPGITPALLFISIIDTIESYRQDRGQFYARLEWRIDIEGLPAVHCHDFVSGLGGVGSSAGRDIAMQVSRLERNPFKSIQINSITLDLIMGENVQAVLLESARLSKPEYEPGDEMDINLLYRPYKKETKRFVAQLRLPDDMVPGYYELSISDASQALMHNMKRAPSLYKNENIRQFINQINESYAQNQLILEIWAMNPSIAVQGTEYARIPGSISNVLNSIPQSGVADRLKKTLVMRKIIDTNYQISGYELIPFRVSQKSLLGR